MAESSRRKIPTRRRTAPRPTQPSTRSASIEGWISNEERRDEFIQIWKNKAIIFPKYINSRKFTATGFEFPALFNFQGIRQFVEMQGKYYPDLIRVFYYNLGIRDEVAYSRVKGVDIIIQMIKKGENKFKRRQYFILNILFISLLIAGSNMYFKHILIIIKQGEIVGKKKEAQ